MLSTWKHCAPYFSTRMRVLLSLTLLCGLLSAVAQPLRFRQVSMADGLTDNAITALHQDRQGFLWIGTEYGLNKYDGHHVWAWHAPDGLGGEHVSAIMEDHAGTLWVATRQGGLARFGSGNTIAHTYTPGRTAGKGVEITCLFDLNDTTLMIGAQQLPIIFMDKRSGRCTYWKGHGPITPEAAVDSTARSGDWCHYIRDLGDGRLAIGFLLNFKQYIVDRATGAILGPAFHFGTEADDQTITDAVRMGDRLFGVGWQRRLYVQDLNGAGHRHFALPDEATALIALDNTHLLIGTRNSGLLQLDVRTGGLTIMRHHRGDPDSPSDDRVRALLRDDEGRIWSGTRNGLGLHDPQHWWMRSQPLHTAAPNDGPDVQAFGMAALPDGRLAVCTNEGLYLREPNGAITHLPLHGPFGHIQPTVLHPFRGGWLVGAEQGLFLWDGRSARVDTLRMRWRDITRREPAQPASQAAFTLPRLFQVRHIDVDTTRSDERIMLGVMGYGVVLLDMQVHTIEYLIRGASPEALGSNLVRCMARTADGTHWVGTVDGLYRWEPAIPGERNRFTAFRAGVGPQALPVSDVLGLLATGDTLWVAMRNGGLARWDGRTMQALPCPHPTGSTIHGLAADREGRIWCAGSGAFEVYHPRTGAWTHVPVPRSGPIAQRPAATTAFAEGIGPLGGHIAFVTGSALHLFDPARLDTTAEAPPPYPTDLRMAGKPAMDRIRNGRLALAADEHMLTIAVSALDLAPMEPLRFAIMLEGIDPAPRMTDANGALTYASLPPGTYRLLAHTVAANGRMSAPVTIATIAKAAPLWQRWWFIALLAAAIGGVVYAVTRYRYQQQLKLQAVRVRIASDLHDEVGSSLSSITIGSQLAAKLTPDGSTQVKELLQRIGETSSASLRSISDIVWAIDPKNDQGEALVKRMQRIAHELLESKGIEVPFSVGGGVEDLHLPMEVRKELLLIYKEAVHNASKYSGATRVQVALHRRDGALYLRVEDNGRGFDPALHPDGHGLGSMRRRAGALGAELRIESAAGKGTCVALDMGLPRNRG